MVKVDKFKVPMDFVMLEMKGALVRNKEQMIFHGRPFMAITKIVIDVQNGKLTMTVSGETVELKAANSSLYPFTTFQSQCSFVNLIDLLVSNPSFQGRNGIVLEDAHSKAKWKRR